MKKFAKVFSMMLVVALAAVMFTGCVLSAEKATEKLKKKDYTVVSSADSGLGAAVIKAAAGVLKAEDIVWGANKDGETVYIVYFKEKEDAKKVAEDKKKLMKELKIDESKDDEIVMKQSGNAVVIGTKKAVKLVA